MTILTLNAGSSSIKFALYEQGQALQRVLRGQVDRIGHADAAIDVERTDATAGKGTEAARHAIAGGSFEAAVEIHKPR